MSTVRTIEMHPAYVWDCDSCGTENFERAVVCELSVDDIAAIEAAGEVDAAETGNWVTCPERVTCRVCGQEFGAKHFQAGDDLPVEYE